MNANTLRTTLTSFLPRALVIAEAKRLNVVQRSRKKNVFALVMALVLADGSDDSGRQIDVFSMYQPEVKHAVVRSTFYGWFNTSLMLLMGSLLQRVLDLVAEQQPLLEHGLKGVSDWIAVDSETVTLRSALKSEFPGTSTDAALKVHKVYSLGRNNMIGFHVTAARDHDGPQLGIDESWRGKGLLVDLGYASFERISSCAEHGVGLVMRLKENWNVLLRDNPENILHDLEIVDGEVLTELLTLEVDEDSKSYDLDVLFGKGANQVSARLVGVPSTKKYHWYITLLSRESHTPDHVSDLYRTRWMIELDNRRDKGGARLDQLSSTTRESTLILVYASLLRNVISNALVHADLLERPKTRPPLHAMALSLAIRQRASAIMTAVMTGSRSRWTSIAHAIRLRGEDPNWRKRPSKLDQLRGTTAPPGRPRRQRQSECPPSAQPYRRASV